MGKVGQRQGVSPPERIGFLFRQFHRGGGLAAQNLDYRQTLVGRSGLRLERDRFAQRRLGLFVTAQRGERDGASDVDCAAQWIEHDRPLIQCDRFVEPAKIDQQESETVRHAWILRCELRGTAEFPFGVDEIKIEISPRSPSCTWEWACLSKLDFANSAQPLQHPREAPGALHHRPHRRLAADLYHGAALRHPHPRSRVLSRAQGPKDPRLGHLR